MMSDTMGFYDQRMERNTAISNVALVLIIAWIAFVGGRYWQYFQPVTGMDTCVKVMGQIDHIQNMMLPVKMKGKRHG